MEQLYTVVWEWDAANMIQQLTLGLAREPLRQLQCKCSLNYTTEISSSPCTKFRECCRQIEAEVIRNSRNKFHQP